MPGPPVVVCKGDQIIVTVINKLHGATATLHFHGKQIIDIPDRLRSAARERKMYQKIMKTSLIFILATIAY